MHNIAIVVARTDAAACECLAESMQRGTPELTMQDAVRAGQAELRRAARARDLGLASLVGVTRSKETQMRFKAKAPERALVVITMEAEAR